MFGFRITPRSRDRERAEPLGDARTAAVERHEMVQRQLASRGIGDAAVLRAMEQVAREEFLPSTLRELAYADQALPISCGQTISQPYTVAFMIDAARLDPGDRVLEIGTGSGYGAAVLSRIVREVHTVERIAELADDAAKRLARLGYDNVQVHRGDGTLGYPAAAPFDAILVTAGAKVLPAAYFDQLTDGGRIIIPVGPTRRQQSMYRFTRDGEQLRRESLGSFVFVPLIGVHGWSNPT